MVLGRCLLAIADANSDDIDAVIDARVGAIRIGEALNLVCMALKQKG